MCDDILNITLHAFIESITHCVINVFLFFIFYFYLLFFYDVWIGSVRNCSVRIGSVQSGSVRIGPVRYGPVRIDRFGSVRSGSIGSVRFGPDRSVRFEKFHAGFPSFTFSTSLSQLLCGGSLLALVTESTRAPRALLWAPAPRLRSSQCASGSQQRVKTHP